MSDVLLHPLQRGDEIGGAGIARLSVVRTVGREVERPENVETVVYADDDYIAELAEIFAIVGVGFHRRAVSKAAAVQPDHYRLFDAGGGVAGPDIEDLAAFIGDPEAVREDEFVWADLGLRRSGADRAPALGIHDALPWLDGFRQLESFCDGVRDSEEDRRIAIAEAAKLAAFDFDEGRDEVGLGGRCRLRFSGGRKTETRSGGSHECSACAD